LSYDFRSLNPCFWVCAEAGHHGRMHHVEQSYSSYEGLKREKKKGSESQCPLQGHIPNDLTFFFRPLSPNGPTTSHTNMSKGTKLSIHEPFGDIEDLSYSISFPSNNSLVILYMLFGYLTLLLKS
jgi:hypothetical protein